MTEQTYIDTHAHLDDEQFADDLSQVLDEASALGVYRFINIGYGPARWPSSLDLAGRDSRILHTLGLHPTSSDEWSQETFATLTHLVRTTNPVGIGEIGLDYYWTKENKSLQRTSFEAQIDLAIEVDLPIVIHQRSAGSDVAAILRNASESLRVLLHSFDGDLELHQLALERRWTIGVGGLMTRRQNVAVRELLLEFPLDQMVLETDSPYLVPSGSREKRNTPGSIPLIAARLAALIDREISEIAEVTTANAIDFFRIKTPAVMQ